MRPPALEREREPLAQIFHDTVSGYLRALPPSTRRLWLLVPVTGALAGVGAVALVRLLHLVETLAWGPGAALLDQARHAGPLRRVGLPLVGGALLVVTGLLFRGASAGHGTSGIVEAIWARRGRVALMPALLAGVLAIVVVGLGASLGREGALIYCGAAVASFLGRRFRLRVDQQKLLVACGATAGIAAAYNTPLGGALFGLEVLLGGLSLELYGPLIVASVTATLVSRALLFDHPTFVIPDYRLHHPAELGAYVVVGLGVGALAGLFVRTVEASARAAQSAPPWLRRLLPLFGLGLVGVAGLAFPELYGNGYDAANLALEGALPLHLLFLLPLLKLVLSAACASFGAPGGLFTPSLFIGALGGGAVGALGHRLWPALIPESGACALVGMGAILAGSTHATLAAALLLFELTGSYDLILPLLMACVLATAVSRRITAESIYTAPLKRRGVDLPRILQPAWMQHEGVRALVRRAVVRVPPDARLDEVLLAMVGLREGEALYVVDRDQRLRGAVDLAALREAIAEQPDLSLLIGADVMRPASAVSIDASLWEVTRLALAAGAGDLPVVSPREDGRFVGVISIPEVLAAARRDRGAP
jgi:CIC family chloride channel protein